LAHILAVPGHSSAPRSAFLPFLYDNEISTTAIADFVESLFRNDVAQVTAPELKLSAVRAILWTDLEGHTPIMQRLGDDAGREVLREHERLVRDALTAHGGTEVKTMGDGFVAWFSSAQQALSCAVSLQRTFADRNAGAAEPLHVRVGINAGEPLAEQDDLFGNSVIAAARICHEAAGDEIVVSDVVRQLVAGKGFAFTERGLVALKGFDEALRLFNVTWRE
jgi:class 3 adenylate cyclase